LITVRDGVVAVQPALVAGQALVPAFAPSWYPDPWGVAPWRWWDGTQWTPVIYGPYGEAWPLQAPLAPPFVPKGPGIKGGGVAAVGAGVGLVGAVAVAISYAIGTHGQIDVNDPWYLLAGQLALWVGFVGAVLVASRMNGTRSLVTDYGLSWPRLKDLWLGLGGAVVGRILPLIVLIRIVVAGSGFGTPNGAAPEVLGVTPSSTAGWVVVIVLAVLGAPLVEELFFRGLLQGAFTRRVGAVPSLFITALIFSFAHVLNEGPLAPLALFPMAVVLGYLRYRTGRLAAGMVAHALFNASLLALFLIPAFR
jgi:membrane protease YdiL (CAAX protease family)